MFAILKIQALRYCGVWIYSYNLWFVKGNCHACIRQSHTPCYALLSSLSALSAVFPLMNSSLKLELRLLSLGFDNAMLWSNCFSYFSNLVKIANWDSTILLVYYWCVLADLQTLLVLFENDIVKTSSVVDLVVANIFGSIRQKCLWPASSIPVQCHSSTGNSPWIYLKYKIRPKTKN